MISKCENVVINRTKFSDFVDFNPAEGTDGLKLVGYVDGPNGKQNISVDFGALLDKNGELAAKGFAMGATLIAQDTTPVAINVICDRNCGIIINDNSLDYIQIDRLTKDNALVDAEGILDIAFANSSYATGQRVEVLFYKMDGGIKLYSRAADEIVYNGDFPGQEINVLVRFIKVEDVLSALVPVDVYIGLQNHFYPYGGSNAMVNTGEDNILNVTSASVKYVVEEIDKSEIELKSYTDGKIDELELRTDKNISDIKASLDDEDAKLSERIDAISASLDASDLDLNKILHIEKFKSLQELESAAKSMTAQKLSRLIALVAQDENDTYAEYICLNADKEGETKVFHLLGAVDTVFASDENIKQHGSVVLVANVDENTFDSEKYGKLSPTSGKYTAAAGYALSPIALADIYKKYKETQELIGSEIEKCTISISTTYSDLTDAIDNVENSLTGEVDTLKDEMKVVFKELGITENEADNINSRVDIIEERIESINNGATDSIKALEDLIGINGCHEGCSCEDKDACSGKGKCTILCRVAENERDIDVLSTQIVALDGNMRKQFDNCTSSIAQLDEKIAAIDGENGILQALAEGLDARFDEVNTSIDGKINQKNSEIQTLNDLIAKNEGNITLNTERIASNAENIGKFYAKFNVVDNSIETLKIESSVQGGNIAGIINHVSEIEHNIATNGTDIMLTRSELNAHKSAYDTAQAEVLARLNTAESNIDAAKTAANTATSTANSAVTYATDAITRSEEAAANTVAAVSEAKKSADEAKAATKVAEQANLAAMSAKEQSDTAVATATAAEKTAEAAVESVEKTADKVEKFILAAQQHHTFLVSYSANQASGNYVINFNELFGDLDDSAKYNIAVVETRVGNSITYPSISYNGTIDSDGADRRQVVINTGLLNEATAITIITYARALHVRE